MPSIAELATVRPQLRASEPICSLCGIPGIRLVPVANLRRATVVLEPLVEPTVDRLVRLSSVTLDPWLPPFAWDMGSGFQPKRLKGGIPSRCLSVVV